MPVSELPNVSASLEWGNKALSVSSTSAQLLERACSHAFGCYQHGSRQALSFMHVHLGGLSFRTASQPWGVEQPMHEEACFVLLLAED